MLFYQKIGVFMNKNFRKAAISMGYRINSYDTVLLKPVGYLCFCIIISTSNISCNCVRNGELVTLYNTSGFEDNKSEQYYLLEIKNFENQLLNVKESLSTFEF